VAVSGYRRRSLPIKDSSFLALADRLRRKLGIGRHVELRVSSDLSTAATIGWLKPVILVPTDWWRWSDQERRAVLGHELAHISHNDYFAVLMAQFSIALHFYHPIVHWLAGRLRLEQELAADAAAAELAGGRQQYLTTLAAMALRESDRPIGWAARGFLPVRGAFLKRIESLRSGSAPKRLTACGHGLTIAALVVAGVLVSGL
ncbi:MAG: M56 family metallopeptidase, partial [Pirellulaceae bacterium]|nr:M56 family metallopeptidase [Pirellulaceae bacterium]